MTLAIIVVATARTGTVLALAETPGVVGKAIDVHIGTHFFLSFRFPSLYLASCYFFFNIVLSGGSSIWTAGVLIYTYQVLARRALVAMMVMRTIPTNINEPMAMP